MKFVYENDLEVSFPHLDNVTICGKDQEDHDADMECFHEAASCTIQPEPDHLRPLQELPIPHNSRSTNRCLGLFSCYSKWIPRLSD